MVEIACEGGFCLFIYICVNNKVIEFNRHKSFTLLSLTVFIIIVCWMSSQRRYRSVFAFSIAKDSRFNQIGSITISSIWIEICLFYFVLVFKAEANLQTNIVFSDFFNVLLIGILVQKEANFEFLVCESDWNHLFFLIVHRLAMKCHSCTVQKKNSS